LFAVSRKPWRQEFTYNVGCRAKKLRCSPDGLGGSTTLLSHVIPAEMAVFSASALTMYDVVVVQLRVIGERQRGR
jgi:hypothetical protein